MQRYLAAFIFSLIFLAGLDALDASTGASEDLLAPNVFSIELQGTGLPGHDIEKMWYYTNVRRAQYGRQPLYLDPEMNCRAHAWAYLMSTRYGLTHSNNQLAFFPMGFAENIAIGYNAQNAVLDGWTNSAGHFQNMMGNHRTVGVAKYGNSTVQIFRSGTRPLAPLCLTRNGLVQPGGSYSLIPPQPVFSQPFA